MDFAAILAWSWSGHGELTTLIIAAAVSQVAKNANLNLLKRFELLKRTERDGRTENLYENVDGVPTPDRGQAEKTIVSLLQPTPKRVQEADLHGGNIPWGIGEFLDKTGQVRHFMRSTEQWSEKEAYSWSTDWIKSHLKECWSHFKDGLFKNYEFGFSNLFSSGNIGDFDAGMDNLAQALHTIEDSYAPGHVQRNRGVPDQIEAVHYWDAENKTAHDDWPGHEALDNPKTEYSKPFYVAAQKAGTELVVCVLKGLSGDRAEFVSKLNQIMAKRFHFKGD